MKKSTFPVKGNASSTRVPKNTRAGKKIIKDKAILLQSREDLKIMLTRAEQHLMTDGLESALKSLSIGLSSTSEDRSVLAERLALLGQSIHSRNPKMSLLLAQRAIQVDSRSVSAWLLAAVSQDKLGFGSGTVSALKIVIQSPFAKPDQIFYAANVLARYGHQETAIKAARAAYVELGRPLEKASQLLYIAQRAADWRLADELVEEISREFRAKRFNHAWASPRTMLNWCDNEDWNLQVMRSFSIHAVPIVRHNRGAHETPTDRKLRIGYLSSDFRNHPCAHWVKGLLRHHDQTKVECLLYCSGWDDGSTVRREVLSLADKAYSVSQLDDMSAADLIRSHRLDVLVDLNGPTRGQRLGILAQRPAPVLVHYIGWPGSLGGRIVDYIVGDDYVMPKSLDKKNPERIIRLSATYQVNDYSSLQRLSAPTREQAGLPTGHVRIIGVFNSVEKISAEVWATWMQVLQQVPDSVIWLLDPGQAAQRSIMRATEVNKVDPNRIVIAARLASNESHLARLSLCDIMLDPWPYGGHTTTSDALFAGVPVIALRGRNFAGRVSGSLLRAAGLEHLIAPDKASYIEKAVYYLRHPLELSQLKSFIASVSPTQDIFDARGKALQLEAAYREIVARSAAGKNPASIDAIDLVMQGGVGSF